MGAPLAFLAVPRRWGQTVGAVFTGASEQSARAERVKGRGANTFPWGRDAHTSTAIADYLGTTERGRAATLAPLSANVAHKT